MQYNHEWDFDEEMEISENIGFIKAEELNIQQIFWKLKYEIKEFFPLNGVPESVLKCLHDLVIQTTLAQSQLDKTLDIIIHEVKKIDGIED